MTNNRNYYQEKYEELAKVKEELKKVEEKLYSDLIKWRSNFTLRCCSCAGFNRIGDTTLICEVVSDTISRAYEDPGFYYEYYFRCNSCGIFNRFLPLSYGLNYQESKKCLDKFLKLYEKSFKQNIRIIQYRDYFHTKDKYCVSPDLEKKYCAREEFKWRNFTLDKEFIKNYYLELFEV